MKMKDKKNRNKDITIIVLVYAILFLGAGIFMYKTEAKALKQQINRLTMEVNDYEYKIQNNSQ